MARARGMGEQFYAFDGGRDFSAWVFNVYCDSPSGGNETPTPGAKHHNVLIAQKNRQGVWCVPGLKQPRGYTLPQPRVPVLHKLVFTDRTARPARWQTKCGRTDVPLEQTLSPSPTSYYKVTCEACLEMDQ